MSSFDKSGNLNYFDPEVDLIKQKRSLDNSKRDFFSVDDLLHQKIPVAIGTAMK